MVWFVGVGCSVVMCGVLHRLMWYVALLWVINMVLFSVYSNHLVLTGKAHGYRYKEETFFLHHADPLILKLSCRIYRSKRSMCL